MDYTICSEVIKRAKEGNRFTFDLLMPFTYSINPHRVVLNPHIISEYSQHYNDIIRTWINGITSREFYKIVEIEDFQHLFPDTCKLTHDARLIVCEKEDYPIEVCTGITVLDKDEAIADIRPKNVQINQTGEGHQASTGDNSPINE